jgi:carbon storage regulator CsrA
MLVLTRKQRESVVVGESDGVERLLRVTVLAIHGGAVRLGFEARREFPVHRGEVWERIHARAGPARPIAPRQPVLEAAGGCMRLGCPPVKSANAYLPPASKNAPSSILRRLDRDRHQDWAGLKAGFHRRGTKSR